LSTALPSLDQKPAKPAAELSPAAGAALRGALRRRRRPTDAEASGSSRRTPLWLEALTIVWLCWAYDAVTNLAPLRLGAALSHGREILSAEQTLGIAPERSLDSWLAGHHTLGVVVSYYYDNAHFVVTLGLLAFLWWRRADVYRPLRNALVLINVLGFVVFWRYPVAPPRMLGGFTDVVAASHALGSWHTGALASDANQLAAMPSLHIAWAVWCTVAVWRITRRTLLRTAAALYPFLTCFGVLATGNHYVLDVLAGAVLAAVSLAIVALAPWRRPLLRRGSRGPAPARAG
jgi:membrane-associated phospholipid phosphatase